MCAVFGFYDYGHQVPQKTLLRLIRELSVQAECRGTDATGISYVNAEQIKIFKVPKPAHQVRFYFPAGTACVMGHTRCATQGEAKQNQNNHPFLGRAGDTAFSLAHNGVIWNNAILRRNRSLPKTDIQTDSYVAVQLLEKAGKLDFQSIAETCETVEGSFVFTILDQQDTLWLAKGTNPLCLAELKDLGLFVYASTQEILRRALRKCRLYRKKQTRIQVETGDILKIGMNGVPERSEFHLSPFGAWDFLDWPPYPQREKHGRKRVSDDLLELAELCSVEEEEVEELIRLGYSESEIEEMLEDPGLFQNPGIKPFSMDEWKDG